MKYNILIASLVAAAIGAHHTAACKEVIAVFHSCFANNPAAPYFVPEPPVSGSAVNPDYAIKFVTPGPTGAPSTTTGAEPNKIPSPNLIFKTAP